MVATSTINTAELINLTQSIAQLNLGYLGISVAILGLLGGVFIYFNIKPLKDALDKQETTINDLKKEADNLLEESKLQTESKLNEFQSEQSVSLLASLLQQKEKINLETRNQLQETERGLLEKIDLISENKDIKLREIIISEITNRNAVLEKNLTVLIKSAADEADKRFLQLEQLIAVLKSNLRDAQRDIKELKVYKFSKENKMGAVIYSIELLKEDIDEKRWSILNSLERLKGEIQGMDISAKYVAEIEEQLARIKDDSKYRVISEQIRKMYSEATSS